MKIVKIALLGVCNSRYVIEAAARDNDISVEPYIFQPCFLDITKEGLGIPYKKFYELPPIEGKEETAIFTKKTMQFDLNKTALSTIESINPNYLVIDLSTLAMKTYEVELGGKKVFSCNAYSPSCYEHLQENIKDLHFQKVDIDESFIKDSINELSEYLKNNWDLSKVIIFNYIRPKYYMGLDKKIYKYPTLYWGVKQAETIKIYTKYLSELLPSVKVFEDSDIKIGYHSKGELERKEPIPSSFHTSENTQKLQGLLFRKFLFNECNEEIDKIKNILIEEINTKLCS